MVILLWIICPFQEVFTMARKSYTTEQIIGLLRQAEVMLSQGKTLDTVIREIGVTRNIYSVLVAQEGVVDKLWPSCHDLAASLPRKLCNNR